MNIVADTHMHTLASGHAFNTILEMVSAAKAKGLEMIAITEHAPAMQGSCGPIYFHNLQATRYPFDGIEVLFGVELNIMDYEGTVDLDEKGMKRTDLRIASMHVQCIKPGTEAENTRGILGAIQNPYVDIIGHPDDSRFPMTYEPIIKAAAEYGKIIELNSNSFNPKNTRVNAWENDHVILKLCEQYRVPIVISSDAHSVFELAEFTKAKELVEEMAFPEELILNTSVEKLKGWLSVHHKV